MPSLKSFFVFIIIALNSLSARAELVKAIEIRSDYFPDLVFEVGFDVNSNHLIDRVYFIEGDEAPTFFTLDELQEDYAVVFKRWGFEMVRMKIVNMDSATAGKIELSYLRNASLGTRRSVFYSVSLTSRGVYEIVDLRTGKPMKNALVKTNYTGRIIPIGIRDIESK
jgi:hypothetical protein